jgi:glycerol-3-phosphate acyltransferase PlsY
LCLVSYLVGALPFGLWIGRMQGVDIRTAGSGNIGATNVLRVLGPAPGAISLVLDVLKGMVGIIALHLLWGHILGGAPAFGWLALTAVCAILGHTFSPFLRFKGGKGVATTMGALLALCWPIALVGLAVWLLVLAATRYVSAASIVAAISLPISTLLVPMPTPDARPWMLGISLALMLLVVVRHKANIARLRAGTESKIGQRVAPTVAATKAERHG